VRNGKFFWGGRFQSQKSRKEENLGYDAKIRIGGLRHARIITGGEYFLWGEGIRTSYRQPEGGAKTPKGCLSPLGTENSGKGKVKNDETDGRDLNEFGGGETRGVSAARLASAIIEPTEESGSSPSEGGPKKERKGEVIKTRK